MVNARLLPGKNLTAHPLAGEQAEGVYVRGAPFMAIRAEQGGRLDTPNGVKTFHAGDWVCTDIPPTYAWILDQQTFQVAGFTHVGDMDPDQQIVFPIAEAGEEVEHDLYTGRQEVELPANASEVVAFAPESVAGGSTDVPASMAIASVPGENPADTASKSGGDGPLTGDKLFAPSAAEIAASEPKAPVVSAPAKASLPKAAPVRSKAPAKDK